MTIKALILCAGFGTRMGELTQHCPKPMLTVGDKPLLLHTINQLKKIAITEIYLNVHYLKEQIINYFGDGSNFGVKIHYLYESTPSGTAGPVKKLQNELLNSECFLVLYGDILTNVNFNLLIDSQLRTSAVATIFLHKNINSNSIVTLAPNGKITTFLERPTQEQLRLFKSLSTDENSIWANSGLYCMSPKIFKHIPDLEVIDFPKNIFPKLVETNELFGIPLVGTRVALDTPDRYIQANKLFNNLINEELI